MTGVFLQARLSSERLPGKVLMPVAGRPLVAHAMSALRLVPADCRLLLTDSGSAEALAPVARANGFDVIVGSELDVLDRFAQAARRYRVATIVRATGDNPLVSFELAGMILRDHRASGADYSGFAGIAVGAGVEVLGAAALLDAAGRTACAYDREHVTPHLYRNPSRYLIHRPLAPRRLRSRARITVDTREDFDRVSAVFAALYRGMPPAHAEVLKAVGGA